MNDARIVAARRGGAHGARRSAAAAGLGAPQRGAGGRESTLRMYRHADRADVGWRAAQDAVVPAARAGGAGRRARGHAARCSNATGMVHNGIDRYPTED
jgi:hypothetical protein